MRSILAFFALSACAGCAIDDEPDRPAGPFDTSGMKGRPPTADEDKPPPPPNPPPCEYGNTMTSPHFVGAPVETAGDTALRFAWNAGTGVASDLPAEYFEKVRVEEGCNRTAMDVVTS